jgi:hypothetical protein
MCIDCWLDYEDSKVINDKVTTAVKLINELYDYHSAGGNLHVVLDDWNLDSIETCKNFIDNEQDPIKKEIELRVYNHISNITENELASALALKSSFITI